MRTFLTVILTFTIIGGAVAQDDSTRLRNMPAQITFFYPIGSNGANTNFKNNLSINLLAGVNGGLDGFEFGGLYNQNKYDANGLQFAGIANLNQKKTNGVQFGGIFNASNDLEGVQFSGCVNLARDVEGVQIGGLFNAGRYFEGAQIAGFMNISELIEGSQISGFLNLADTIDGPQISGFMNTTTQADGSQIAGFMNLTRECNGIQIAGFINATEHARGSQIAGFMNICDTIEGIPLAPINIIKNGGYYAFDISTNESLFMDFAFLMGIRDVYTIYKLGFQPSDERYSLGAGIGIATKLSPKSYLDVQGIVSHINEGYKQPFEYTNLLNQLKLNYELELHETFKFYAGPSFNVLVSNYKDDAGNLVGADVAPWTISEYDGKNGKSKTSIWPGFTIGFKIKT